MKYIIVVFLAVMSMTAGDTQPYLLKKIVSGGNDNPLMSSEDIDRSYGNTPYYFYNHEVE